MGLRCRNRSSCRGWARRLGPGVRPPLASRGAAPEQGGAGQGLLTCRGGRASEEGCPPNECARQTPHLLPPPGPQTLACGCAQEGWEGQAASTQACS